MDQQHPIPQEISSYQFRLVGDMTLKQFFQLAGGLLVSLLFYASNLPALIKWPLIILFALIGVALAFIPFEDRPLSTWILSFFSSIYSPTIFLWKKTEKPTQYFQPEQVEKQKGEVVLDPKLQQHVQKHSFLADLEAAEKKFLSSLSSLISGKNVKPRITTQQQQVTPGSVPLAVEKTQGGVVQVPKLNSVTVEKSKTQRPKMSVEEQGFVYEKPKTTKVSPAISSFQSKSSVQAVFSPDAAPPLPPSKPNTVSGQVIDSQGKIVESAILEIKDVGGRPVRAVKTNKLGHFLIVTPLQNGTYTIITEKEGHEFDDIGFDAQDKIIPPIAIRARKKLVTKEVN